MLVNIKDISQALSLKTGESYSFLTIELPTGAEIRAVVEDAAIATITQIFIGSGSPAAQAAAARAQGTEEDESRPSRLAPEDNAAFQQMVRAQAKEPQPRSYAPMDFSDGEPVATFGGDFEPESAELAAVSAQLRAGEDQLARAIGDTSTLNPAELHQVVERIANTPPQMPVPSIMATQAAPTRRLNAPRVEADSMGNPIMQGNGLIDPRGLMGGNTEGEEDVGQV